MNLFRQSTKTVTDIKEMRNELIHQIQMHNLPYDCLSSGIINAEVAVIGEAVGYKEKEIKTALASPSNRVLWDALRVQGISRNAVYTTNVIKKLSQSVNGGYKSKLAISKNELTYWYDILKIELSMLPNLKYIIALGNFPLLALTGNDGINNWRGSVLPVTIGDKTVQVIHTINPALINRDSKMEVVFKMDINKLVRVRNGEYSVPKFEELIKPSYKDALDFLRFTHDRALSGNYLSCDIETMANQTACVGISATNEAAMAINFRNKLDNQFTTNEEADIRIKLQEILADPKVKRVAQNGNFDAYWMGYKDRIRWNDIWIDTMLGHFLLYPSLPHNLGFITTQYTDHPYYKDDGKNWREKDDIDQFWRYCCKDVIITRMAAYKIEQEMKDQGVYDTYRNHVAKLGKHLVSMTVNGLLIDQTLKAELSEKFAGEVAALEKKFVNLSRIATGDEELTVNPNSPKQLSELLFEKLRLVGRGTATDSENRARMFDNPRTNDESKMILATLDEYKEKHKFLTTYVNSRIDVDGRMRCEYKQTGVVRAPGRLSSSSVLWGAGMNLQNQNEASKEMFIADEGYEFTYFDAAQIEARLVAYFAGIESWKEQFARDLAYRRGISNTPYDAHCALAADMYRIPYDEVPKYDFEPDGTKTIRFKAKRARHGLNYRMEADRLATTAGLPLSEAREIYSRYHFITPELKVWWKNTIDEARTKKVLYTPMGIRWLNLGRFDDNAADSIVAFRPQSTAGTHIARVIYRCHEDERWPRDARIVLNVHDALIALNRPEDGKIVRAIMKEYAEAPIMINGEECIVPCDFARSFPDEKGLHRWSNLKKIKPEDM